MVNGPRATPHSSGGADSKDTASPEGDPHQQHFSTEHLLENLKGRTISSALITATAQGVLFVLTLGSTMVLARLLQPSDFGLIAMVVTVMGFLRNFKNAGLSSATVQRETITHAQVSNLFWINIALGGSAGLIVAASAPAVAWFYREPRLVAITLALSFTFFFEGSTVQHMALLNRQMRFKAIAVIQIGAQVAAVSVGVGMAWFKCGYWSLVGFQLATPLATLLLTWTASRWRPQLPTRRSGIRPLVSFGANLTASSFIYSLAGGADSLLIGRFYGPDPVGLYTRAGALLRRPLEQFLSPINAVFIPVLSRVQSQPERYRRTFLQVFEAMALAGFLFSGLGLVLARPLTLVVLGPKWEQAAPIFAVFTIAAIFLPLTNACAWLFESQGRGRDALITSSIIAGTGICAVVAGLPFGAVGVAIAGSATGLLVQLPFFFHLAGRSGPVHTADLWAAFLRQLPGWGIVSGAALLARVFVTDRSPLLQLLVGALAGAIAGTGFIFAYPPSRRIALSLMETWREFAKGRSQVRR